MVAVLLYGLSLAYSVLLWRKGFRRDDWVNYGLIAGAFLFHTGSLVMRGFSLSRCPVNNLYEAIAFVGWTIVAIYLVMGVLARFRFLGAFASPLLFAIGVLALMPGLDIHPEGGHDFNLKWASLHAALILLAYGAFGLSAIAGLMYLSQERELKIRSVRALFAMLPPIQRLETVIDRVLLAGFILLTAGLGLAPLLIQQTPEAKVFSDPKLVWSALVWAIYLGILIYHRRFTAGGKRLAWAAVGSFCFVMLTFWGVNLLSGMHNP